MSDRKIRFYYTKEEILFYMDKDNDKVKTHNIKEKKKYLQEKYNYFEVSKDYEATEEGLKQYKNDFIIQVDNFKKYLKKIYINYEYDTKYNHNDAVFKFYNYIQARELKKIKLDPIYHIELYYFENCYNGAIISLFDNISEDIYSYGYDYSSYYPNLLNSGLLYLPMKQGKLTSIKKLDLDNLKYGIYRVRLTITQSGFIDKFFKFNKTNFYTHYDILVFKRIKEIYESEKQVINIELLDINKENNCIIWNDDELINTKDIFGKWFITLEEVKKKLKDNMIVKRCFSSLWGSISQFNRTYIDENDIDDVDVSRLTTPETTEYKLLDIKTYNDNNKELGYKKVYVCCKNDDPYKSRLCRLKPFLLSLSRCNIINLILENKEIEKTIIRIHTDNITLSQKFDFKKAGYDYYPIPEEKTTGKIEWKSSNNYRHKCEKCNCIYKYDKNLVHQCQY
jgi:hypothetical protein